MSSPIAASSSLPAQLPLGLRDVAALGQVFTPEPVVRAMVALRRNAGRVLEPSCEHLTREAASFARAKALHRRILTLDSHCDTPMFFHKDIRFDRRDPNVLVDLHKMTE